MSKSKTKNKLVKTENESKHITGGYVIPSEVADGIAVAVLAEYRSYLETELEQWRANPKSNTNPDGYWLHPEDVGINIRMIDSLTMVINAFGGVK